MSIAEKIKLHVFRFKQGQPFSTEVFIKAGYTRTVIDKTLSRFVNEGLIQRLRPGIFVRSEYNRFVGKVPPEISKVINLIAKKNGETIQLHGAVAANQFKISTQVPIQPVYYTSGTTRIIRIGELKVKFIHTNNHQKLQYAGKKIGNILALLWYLGKEQLNASTLYKIRKGMSKKEFEALRSCSMPAWMSEAVEQYNRGL
ncbi:MAG: DUF6088 family protein [Legionellales bacterium]|jgi:hypothetical protein